MANEVAAKRAFLVAADKMAKERANPVNIVLCVAALEAALNTMMDEPMCLLLVTAEEAAPIKKKLGI